MLSKIIVTGDNSKTLLIPDLNETYHSTKGAITESKHVFIQEGLDFHTGKDLAILEMGFGTGLNALLTFLSSKSANRTINYQTIEAFPLSWEQVSEMDYPALLKAAEHTDQFRRMHELESQKELTLSSVFSFKRYLEPIQDVALPVNFYDIIYYDAFGPKVQGELWSTVIMSKMYDALKNNGLLVTYCAQGAFKRTLKSLGFEVQSIPGPPGKREMTRAIKVS